MTGALDVFLRFNGPLTIEDYPKGLQGRLVRFDRRSSMTMGRPDYYVHTTRGGWLLGTLEYRNQWQMYSFLLVPGALDIPVNKATLAEIYAMLKELDQR